MDIEMFLDEYPCWEAGGLHHPLILQEMFLQVAHSGRKGGGMHVPLRPFAQPPMSGPAGRHLCHPGGGAQDHQGRK